MKAKRRTSIFHTMPENIMIQLIRESKSITEVFRKLKLRISGASFKIFHHAIKERQMDVSHFTGKRPNLGNFHDKRPLDDIFRHGSHVSNTVLRSKVLKHNLIPYTCVVCNNNGTWREKEIVLPLDHINGDRDDNRLKNLRFLCPNCHAQTETFCGRIRKKTYVCPDCQKTYGGYGQKCRKCSATKNTIFLNRGKICTVKWPSNQELHNMIWSESLTKVAIHLGCSEGAIRKHCSRQKIVRPPMGYWERLKHGYTKEEALISQKRIRPKLRVISLEQASTVKQAMQTGLSLRKAAKLIDFSHSAVLRAFSKYQLV